MTKITSVKIRNRIEQFTNETDARSYAKKHGGEILLSANAGDGIGTQSSMPTRNPFLCTLLGLSTAALSTPREIETAFEANGNKSSPRDCDKIVNALIAFWRSKNGSDVDQTVNFLQKRHPLLFPQKTAA